MKHEGSRSWIAWLATTATSVLLATSVAAQDDEAFRGIRFEGQPVLEEEVAPLPRADGGVVFAGETFTPSVDIVWRSQAAFSRLLEDAVQRAPLERALQFRVEEVMKLREALAERERQVRALEAALAAADRERDALSDLADTTEAAFDRVNDLLVKEQSRTGPLFTWGPQAGVGYIWSGDEGDFGAYAGVGLTYNISGRR